MTGVFYPGLIGKRDLCLFVPAFRMKRQQGTLLLSRGVNQQIGTGISERPGKQPGPFPCITGYDPAVHQFLISPVNDQITCFKKTKLLVSLFLLCGKIFLVSLSDIGNQTNRRSNDPGQIFHFTGLRDPCLEDGEIKIFTHIPNRKRNTHL